VDHAEDDMKRVLAVCCLMLVTGRAPRATEPLVLSVSPRQALAPATVWVRVTVERDAANRTLKIVADGDNFYRSSTIQIEGDRAPRTFNVALKSLPGGDYQIRAVLTDMFGRDRADTHTFANIIGW
jgi:hypothetical protein